MLASGDRLGPYVVVAALGAGGMGEVYRAQDTRLGRTVALKVLTRSLSDRADSRQRFEREARAVSALNHPHICALYDVGQQDGVDFLVMECLEGETLEARLAKGKLPVSQALKYAVHILSALDRAHQAGIVHRDLKPSNIVLTKDGAKLLDFGLARFQSTPLSMEATGIAPLTGEHTILGTLQYMAPEQIEGGQADARSDIFAFGSVLFEMLTGRRAFPGNSQASVIAAIMRAEPPTFEAVGSSISPGIEHIIKGCLAKDPDDRWQSARDLALELRFLSTSPEPVIERSDRRSWRLALAVAGGVLIGAAIGLSPWLFHRNAQESSLVQAEIAAPAGSEFSGFGSAISPNGRYVTFVAMAQGKERLWLRPLDARKARLLEDTDDAQFPFWAPDSQSIGFFSPGKLRRFDLDGVGARTIAAAPNGRGGAWASDGTIVFSPNLNSRLWRVPASGGTAVPATNLNLSNGDVRHNFPQSLPDGRHFLFFAHSAIPERSGPKIGTLGDPSRIEEIPELAGNAFQAVYAPSGASEYGYLIYVRERALFAQRFNTRSRRLEGESNAILSRDSFNVASSPGFLNLTLSSTGILLDGGAQRARNELVWRKRDGTVLQVVGAENDYITPRVSPDGSHIAVTKADAGSGDYDLWVLNAKKNIFSRFTFSTGLDFYPTWFPDGKSIVYASEAAGRLSLFRKGVGGLSEARQLVKNTGPNTYPYDISNDGKWLLFDTIGESNRGDIWVSPLQGNAAPFSFLSTPAAELHPHFSPGPQSGKWIVYTGDESGVDQIYVRRFTRGAADESKWQISSDGGKFPIWTADGSEIVYLGLDGKLMSVPIRFQSDAIEPGHPNTLFDAALPSTPFSRYPYDISADGKQFLVLNASRNHPADTLTVLINWTGLLKR